MHHTSGPEIRLAQLSQPQIFVANMQETNETKEKMKPKTSKKKKKETYHKEVLFWCLAKKQMPVLQGHSVGHVPIGISCSELVVLLMTSEVVARYQGYQSSRSFDPLPSRGLTYPTLGKGKSSSNCHFWGIC